ncbi:MAG: aldo/keto reductase [Muricomes sp.]
MKRMSLGTSGLEVPVIAAGCMRIDALDEESLESYINKCMELGINFFEHADIYGGGKCESVFAEAFARTEFRREDIILQSKCGIVPGVMFDFSKEHIIRSVENSLKRLDTEYLDVLLLHRPDALVEPEEVAEAFDLLNASGKVRNFGVSNHKPMQIELLKKYVKQDLVTNQLQLSIPFANMIANGLEVNMLTDGAVDRDGSVLDYCRLKDMTIQAWSPFQYGFFDGVFIGSSKYPELNQQLEELAERYDVTPVTIAAAWMLRHPAHVQMIAGTTNLTRLHEIALGCDIVLTREEWYQIYLSAGYILP